MYVYIYKYIIDVSMVDYWSMIHHFHLYGNQPYLGDRLDPGAEAHICIYIYVSMDVNRFDRNVGVDRFDALLLTGMWVE